MRLLLLVTIILTYHTSIAADSTAYSCKYRFIKQKEATNPNSKFDDIMVLTIKNKTSLYYSYLTQFGLRNMEMDESKSDYNTIGNTVVVGEGKANNYFTGNESEIINIDYKNKSSIVSDKFYGNFYSYTDTLQSPKWNMGKGKMIILNQACEMATTSYKGRQYTAWFAPAIPFRMGPWLFNGLPGLILKVEDDRKQFLFECIELNTTIATTKVFKPYKDSKKVTKKQLVAKKRLSIQNPIAFIQAESGVSVTASDNSGKSVSTAMPNKPYNPIDLTP